MDQVPLTKIYRESLRLLEVADWNVRRTAYRLIFGAIDDALLGGEFPNVEGLLMLLSSEPFSPLMAPILWQTSSSQYCFRFWRRAREHYRIISEDDASDVRDVLMQPALPPHPDTNYEKCLWLVKQIKDLEAQRVSGYELSAAHEELGMRRLSLEDHQNQHVFNVLLDSDC